ncbi:MAG: cytochrome c [Candidatus Hydrogenedentota bacterium]
MIGTLSRIVTAFAPLLLFCASVFGDDEAKTRHVTFSRDVAPILQENCQMCHRPGEAAPMALLTYEQARPWAKSMREKVSTRAMPPWHADPSVGTWKNERRLTDEEIKTIVAWIDQGTAEGDPADLPPAREWPEGWLMGQPDMVFTLPQEQVLPAELTDEYRYISIPMNLTEDTWVDAVEVRPGNRTVVHHVNVFESSQLFTPKSRAARAVALEANKDENGKQRAMSGEGFGPLGEPGGRVGGFLPGGMPQFCGPGEGVLLPKGASLMLQIHYHKETGEEARDLSSVGVRLSKAPVHTKLKGGGIEYCQFTIPAGEDNYEVVAELTLPNAIHITAMSPHMHLRGKDFEVWAELPDGSRRDILRVPRYDFNWQMTYEPVEPIALPGGTKLHTRAHFDNSSNNPFNPNPKIDVVWGEPTTAEMMLMFFRYTTDGETAETPTASVSGS